MIFEQIVASIEKPFAKSLGVSSIHHISSEYHLVASSFLWNLKEFQALPHLSLSEYKSTMQFPVQLNTEVNSGKWMLLLPLLSCLYREKFLFREHFPLPLSETASNKTLWRKKFKRNFKRNFQNLCILLSNALQVKIGELWIIDIKS